MIDWMGLLVIVAKSSAVYIFIVLAIRLFGKKELAQLSVIDLDFILLISNAVQNAMVGNDTSLQGGMAAAIGLFAINYVLKVLTFRSKKFNEVIQGHAILLIYEGQILHNNLDKAMLTMDEIESAVREHGVERCEDVNLAVMEVDGNISVISNDYQSKSSRKRKAHRALNKQQ